MLSDLGRSCRRVEFATEAQVNFLKRAGLLCDPEVLRSDLPFFGTDVVQCVDIDGFYVVSVAETRDVRLGFVPKSVQRMSTATATEAYEPHGILGFADEDVFDEHFAKVTGGELDSRSSTRAQLQAKNGLHSPSCLWSLLACLTLQMQFVSVSLVDGPMSWCTGASLCPCLPSPTICAPQIR